MVWVTFLISAGIVIFAADRLARYGDIIAVRTRLGGLFVGTILLAGATSLPELLASISAFEQGLPNLAAGNLLGSNMVNMLLLALVDLVNYQVPLLRQVAVNHALTATLASLLTVLVVLFIEADIHVQLGWVGVDSIVLILVYFLGVWAIQRENRGAGGATVVQQEPAPTFPSLRSGVIGFVVAAFVLVLVVPQLVEASGEIAIITGLGASFVGAALLSVVTSLPELLAALSAMRLRAFDMAVGNLFGSSVFNVLGLGLADFFYTNGRFLADIDPTFSLVGLIALLLTNLALLGNLARLERRLLFIEIDALLIGATYLFGLYLLFTRGA